MFGRKVATEEAVTTPGLVLVKPAGSLDPEYLQLAQEIGLVSPAIASRNLLSLMRELEMPCWTKFSAEEFLCSKTTWNKPPVWENLRKVDFWEGKAGWGTTHHFVEGDRDVRVEYSKTIYAKEVPFFAIRLVKTIEDRLPRAYDFDVSDYASAHADPFLLATPKGQAQQGLVIAHWDEPGFDAEPMR